MMRPPVAGPMTEDVESGSCCDCCAAWAFGLGLWATFLGLLNISVGAGPALSGGGHQKVVWAGFLTLHKAYPVSYVNDMAFRPISDTVFLAMAIGCLLWGAYRLNSREGGVAGFLTGLITTAVWPALFSTKESGSQMTAAAWCLLIGLLFYIGRGICYWNWVDVGTYAVTAALLGFGFALKFAAEVAEDDA